MRIMLNNILCVAIIFSLSCMGNRDEEPKKVILQLNGLFKKSLDNKQLNALFLEDSFFILSEKKIGYYKAITNFRSSFDYATNSGSLYIHEKFYNRENEKGFYFVCWLKVKGQSKETNGKITLVKRNRKWLIQSFESRDELLYKLFIK